MTVLSLAGGGAGADEPLVADALTGTFTGSPGGFFICTVTTTSPVDAPDCFLGYVVPEGQDGAGRLRAVGSGFQRSSNFTVLEEISAEPGALAIGAGGAAVDVTFPDLGRLEIRLTPGERRPGWASSACPRTDLAYALGARGLTVYPVVAAAGSLSRNRSSEDVSLYDGPEPVSCFAYFSGPAHGLWRMSHPHSAGHQRYELPEP